MLSLTAPPPPEELSESLVAPNFFATPVVDVSFLAPSPVVGFINGLLINELRVVVVVPVPPTPSVPLGVVVVDVVGVVVTVEPSPVTSNIPATDSVPCCCGDFDGDCDLVMGGGDIDRGNVVTGTGLVSSSM